MLDICGISVEIITGIFDKFSLVKTDSNWIFNIITLSFAQLSVLPFTLRDDTPEWSFHNLLI